MIPTFLDLRTGKIAKSPFDMSFFWWSEGNGSCDCNRHQAFPGLGEELQAQQHKEKPELLPHQSVCFGCKRFIAIDVEGDLSSEVISGIVAEVLTKEQVLVALNSEYANYLDRAHV